MSVKGAPDDSYMYNMKTNQQNKQKSSLSLQLHQKQHCGDSNALAMELPKSWIKPLVYPIKEGFASNYSYLMVKVGKYVTTSKVLSGLVHWRIIVNNSYNYSCGLHV